MELAALVIPASGGGKKYHGHQKFTLQVGDVLKIESQGEEYLEFTVPADGPYEFEIELDIHNL